MKLTQLRDLAAIAETGGLRRAARRLGLSQPALSRSIRELEDELGVRLFDRSIGGMALTEAGRTFATRGDAARRELERAREEALQQVGVDIGEVSIGLSSAAHVALLPRAIGPFRRRFPRVKLHIIESLFPALEAGIRDGSIDFYVGPMATRAPGGAIKIEPLFDNYRVVIGRKGHPLGAARSLDELVTAEWVMTSAIAGGDIDLRPLFEERGLPAPVVAVRTQTALSTITVASSSDLLTILPQQWLGFARVTGLLAPIDLADRLAAPGISIVSRATLPLTPAARYLSDLLHRAAMNQPDATAARD
ncbi:LysR substrate-binding domain-containing protein [Sphingomonas bacterium]|uniref:LysR substrate-binding domain-containing protein n=1 Tax=Sphingomonas bacterium TaxID=1895847 RepID=UPI001576B28A|nr:LysR substrate-binding domain-containing protein [Sphingomonas bacterium]